MATLDQAIESVRRKVSDFEKQRYDDDFYKSAIQFALSKLSHDYATSYLTVESVPADREFLLDKLAALEMCYIRATETQGRTEATGEEDSGTDIMNVSVPDLSISKSAVSKDQQAQTWLSLAAALQAEYDGELQHAGGSSLTAEVEVVTCLRKSTRTGGYMSRKLDPGLPAVSVSGVVDGMDVALTWTKLFSDLFYAYQVYRSGFQDFRDETQIAAQADNHVVEYTDTVLAAGTYFYRVKTVNHNAIKTPSAGLQIEVT